MEEYMIREALRQTFTKILSNLNQYLQANPISEDEVKLNIGLLGEKFHQLEELNKKILESMVNTKKAESEIVEEMHVTDGYKMEFLRAKLEVDKKLTKPAKCHWKSVEDIKFSESSFSKSTEGLRTFLLPKIEIRKFNGNVKDWLQFWSQFKNIHEDPTIMKEDKFQYLIHAMENDSKASELVKSYPCTGENYEKAITALKMRFGRDELLIEVYVQSILELILRNAAKSGKKIPLSKTYDKLQININALESLGVITDKCEIIISTLVESSLPGEMLRNWKKHHKPDHTNVTNGNRLLKLMEFLRTEVEHEERVYFLDEQPNLEKNDTIKKEKTKKKKKKKKANANSMNGLVSCITYSSRKLFRVLIRKIG